MTTAGCWSPRTRMATCTGTADAGRARRRGSHPGLADTVPVRQRPRVPPQCSPTHSAMSVSLPATRGPTTPRPAARSNASTRPETLARQQPSRRHPRGTASPARPVPAALQPPAPPPRRRPPVPRRRLVARPQERTRQPTPRHTHPHLARHRHGGRVCIGNRYLISVGDTYERLPATIVLTGITCQRHVTYSTVRGGRPGRARGGRGRRPGRRAARGRRRTSDRRAATRSAGRRS